MTDWTIGARDWDDPAGAACAPHSGPSSTPATAATTTSRAPPRAHRTSTCFWSRSATPTAARSARRPTPPGGHRRRGQADVRGATGPRHRRRGRDPARPRGGGPDRRGWTTLRLETGTEQPDAQRLYGARGITASRCSGVRRAPRSPSVRRHPVNRTCHPDGGRRPIRDGQAVTIVPSGWRVQVTVRAAVTAAAVRHWPSTRLSGGVRVPGLLAGLEVGDAGVGDPLDGDLVLAGEAGDEHAARAVLQPDRGGQRAGRAAGRSHRRAPSKACCTLR